MNDAINFNDLPKLAKKNPKYAAVFGSLSAIDKKIKEYARDIVEQQTDASMVYIKTELMGQCYNLYLFNAERKMTVGTMWTLVDFLDKCSKQTIEYDIQARVIKMVAKFQRVRWHEDKITWV